MNAVGKIDGGCTPLHAHNVAFGGEDEHFFAKQIGFERADKLLTVSGFALPVHDLSEPVKFFVKLCIGATFLVAPMRRYAKFGNAMHFPCADLDFKGEGHFSAPHERCMQALIHIALGHADIVLKSARDLCP